MEKLREAIRSYLLLEGSYRKMAAAKGKITKLANELAIELGAEKARKLILETLLSVATAEALLSTIEWEDTLTNRNEILKSRFNIQSFYQEGDRVFGWYDPAEQVQAQELPLSYSFSESAYHVTFYRRQDERLLWRSRGFEVAEDLPTILRGSQIEVRFDVKRSLFWLEHGYALPCKLPWHRGRFDGATNAEDECLWVSRSIISAGWWCAWKWWPDCQWWYYERHPEWFTGMDWWGDELPPKRFEPIDDPYALVLGGTR